MDKNNTAPGHLQTGITHHILGDQIHGPLQAIPESLANVRGNQVNNQELFADIRRDRLASNHRHIKFKNSLTRSINKLEFYLDPEWCSLLPLQSLATGQVIRNCPRSVDAIMVLRTTQARRILRDLQVPESAVLDEELRRAVLKEFIGFCPIGF
ncbi:uncharacterized protein F4812DRAFT_442789 [Daldinia caldariorum]|uniref:uncharacterized protein n=1 Tax=Daldinia caldariorum TaxID=326644 RepID=UPI0020084B0E|nr:uncharacterized protein F4812DRAFT_442789 [Daldinia caldariorum]KAI1464619.1 hypothetical protein F4812DRAFT_442789 [Daldinia caldariorum]